MGSGYLDLPIKRVKSVPVFSYGMNTEDITDVGDKLLAVVVLSVIGSALFVTAHIIFGGLVYLFIPLYIGIFVIMTFLALIVVLLYIQTFSQKP